MVIIFVDKNTDVGVYPPAQTYGGYPTAHAHAARHPHQHHHAPHFHGHAQLANHRYLLAERYKTKTCRNYMMTGTCPYQHRCMFAHGQHELRTTDMNVRDGLMTEEAIRSYQRAMTAYNRGELAQMEAAQAHGHSAYGSGHSHSSGSSTPDGNAPTEAQPACACDDCRALYATHNPYYSAVPPASSLGQSGNPYSSAAMLAQPIPALERSE